MQVALSKAKVSNVLYYWYTYPTPINSSYIKDFYNSISKINKQNTIETIRKENI